MRALNKELTKDILTKGTKTTYFNAVLKGMNENMLFLFADNKAILVQPETMRDGQSFNTKFNSEPVCYLEDRDTTYILFINLKYSDIKK